MQTKKPESFSGRSFQHPKARKVEETENVFQCLNPLLAPFRIPKRGLSTPGTLGFAFYLFELHGHLPSIFIIA